MSIFEPIFERLNERGGRYVVVGGLAVVLHGHPRLTADVDLVVDLAPAAALRTIDALVSLGLRPLAPVDPREFADATSRARWIREKGMQVFSLYDPENPLRVVDLFVTAPMDFETLWREARAVPLARTEVRIASLAHLIELKQRAGRPQDRDDVERLREIAARNRSGSASR